MKPETALIKNNQPFYYPKFSKEIHHEIEVVLRISKSAKYIEPGFGANYFDQIGLGIDFTARDLQQKQKEKGLPWEIAKAFNGSAPVSEFFPVADFNLDSLDFALQKNGQAVQTGNTGQMLFGFGEILTYISQFVELKTGDLVFTGTPSGVGAVAIGDVLVGYLMGKPVLEVAIK